MKAISTESMVGTLDWCYKAVINGNKASKPVEELVANYLTKYNNKTTAIRKLVNNQKLKTGTTGFVTGLGGIATMPITIPSDIAATVYVQMRMVASIALINGYDLHDDQVQTFVYACLAGQSVNDFVRGAGITVATKVTTNVIKKIPGTVTLAINRAVGFRLVTKFGQTGVVNLGKAIPVVGAVVGAGFDSVSTSIIAKAAIRTFVTSGVVVDDGVVIMPTRSNFSRLFSK